MKNIILMDLENDYAELFLKNNDISIACLVVASDFICNTVQANKKLHSVYTDKEIMTCRDMSGMDYDIIEEMKGTQSRVENALDRNYLDYQIKKDIYYRALSFWLNIFKKEKIDAVIRIGANHGYPSDGVLCGLAQVYGIRKYTLDSGMTGRVALWEHTNNQILAFTREIGKQDFETSKHYTVDLRSATDQSSAWWELPPGMKRIGEVAYKHFGFLGLEFCKDLLERNFYSQSESRTNSAPYNYFNKLHSYRNMKKLA